MVGSAPRLSAVTVAALLLLPGAVRAEVVEGCADLAPGARGAGATRAIEAEDLVRLRDIGPVDARLAGDPPLTVSPNGRQVAFHLRRASLPMNGYCHGVFVMDIEPDAVPKLVDGGGELIVDSFELAGVENFPAGTPKVITPLWSPDGAMLAYLRRDAGVTQLWRAVIGGGSPAAVTASSADVDAFSWLNPDEIVYATRPDFLVQAEAAARERDGGYFYDRRFFPIGSARPHALGPVPHAYTVVRLSTGAIRPATSAEERSLSGRASVPSSSALVSASDAATGSEAWTEEEERGRFNSRAVLHVQVGGRRIRCSHEACTGRVQGLWWVGDGTLLFMRVEGVNRGTQAFYSWRPTAGAPRPLLRTSGRLIGCQPYRRHKLVCAHERATVPRRLVLLDGRTGKVRLLLDLNPEFAKIRLAPTRRITFRNDYEVWTYADLVLPPGRRPGEAHPLVVTQYTSQGFLRGSTGDEVPIQLLARLGYAVLSFQRPYDDPVRIDARDADEYYRAYQENWIGRRNIVSSLVAGVRAVVAMGVADPNRVGITGLSDGSTTAEFALINTRLFAAASISTCCEEPALSSGLAGPAYEELLRTAGYKRRGEAGSEAFWKPQSLAMNAPKVSTPILIHASDWEYRLATETYSALAAAGQPVAMYVFEKEGHVKLWPRHRLAIYNRNVDWFDYWLRGLRDPNPEKKEQYRRWDALPRPRPLP